jgi:hypothetical protein
MGKGSLIRRARIGFAGLAMAGAGAIATTTDAGASNIFQVELHHCTVLHVGYQNLGPNTVVHWTVSQSGMRVASGQFVSAPGSGFHFLSTPLGTVLDHSRKASVSFAATTHGHALRTTVARAAADPRKPTCPVTNPVHSQGGPVTTPTTATPVTLTVATPPSSTLPTLAFTGSRPIAPYGLALIVGGVLVTLLSFRRPRRVRTRRYLLYAHIPDPVRSANSWIE